MGRSPPLCRRVSRTHGPALLGSEDDNVLETWYRASLRDAAGAIQVKKCFLCAGSEKKRPVGRSGKKKKKKKKIPNFIFFL